MINIKIKKQVPLLLLLMASSTAFAVLMSSSGYSLLFGLFTGGGGKGASSGYETAAAVSDGITGTGESSSYRTSAGSMGMFSYSSRILPAATLKDAYIYPSPFKPHSPGKFQAEKITFKNLTDNAYIRVFNIAGELVYDAEKRDTSVNYYEWEAVNNAGRKLASGVYIFYISNSEGETATGSFAIIK